MVTACESPMRTRSPCWRARRFTFINDVPVKRRALQHGDRVRIGDSQFLFLMHDGEVKSQSSEVKFHDDQVVSGSTLQVRFNDALYLMARDLSALMKVSTTINAI